MALTLITVQKKDLPPSATHGFKLTDPDEPRREMFFHWHKDDAPAAPKAIAAAIAKPHTGVAPEGMRAADGPGPLVSYADVLKALPDRLAAMGYEKMTDEILSQVIGTFGAG